MTGILTKLATFASTLSLIVGITAANLRMIRPMMTQNHPILMIPTFSYLVVALWNLMGALIPLPFLNELPLVTLPRRIYPQHPHKIPLR